ncbi:MAG: PAS domain S-box protein [Betaproteobacteria bacterium]|nr:PAS domain S-box protein [Betaproteobacteria bacterium]
MDRFAKFAVDQTLLVWAILLLSALAVAYLVGEVARDRLENERLSSLRLEAERRGIELMAQTLNGNQMGAIGLLGLIDGNAKQEALGARAPNAQDAAMMMESIARAHDADGTYIVGQDGVIKSSWGVGRPLTGVDVKFRPYFQMAFKGKQNVYAAIGTTTGRRNLYYASPLYAGSTRDAPVIGAVVMRTGVVQLDKMVAAAADDALLLSPQGVVFAASHEEWIGRAAGRLTPERIKEIRQLKQFGTMFDTKDPLPLSFAVDPGITNMNGIRHAVMQTKVNWNDPYGDWTLVLMEDLSKTVPGKERIRFGLLAAIAFLTVGWMVIHLLRGHHRQVLAGAQLAAFSRSRQASADRKASLAGAALKMQQARSPEELAGIYLHESHLALGAMQGVVYSFDARDAMLHLIGHYACAEVPQAKLAMGEGLLGQCAVERRMQVIDTGPAGFAIIRSGLGQTQPVALLLSPILLGDNLLGVVELALLSAPGEAEREQFGEMAALLAINLEVLGRNVHTEEMLAATQAAERAAAEQLAFQQALVDAIPYPVFYKDADTRFLGFNQAYERAFAVKREDLVGKRVLDLEHLPESERKIYQAEDEATIASVGKVEREVRLPFADGRMHDTLYFVSAFRRSDGEPGGLIGTLIDISDMKQAQSDLVRLADAERFNRLAKDREARIVELKQEINGLCVRLSESPRYASAELETTADASDKNATTTMIPGTDFKLVRLAWHSTYECGQPEIDRDHRTLFAVTNDLLNAIVAGRSTEVIGEIVDTLAREATQHFAREEAILSAHGYPHTEEHARIHRELTEKAVHLIGEFKAGRVEAGPFFQFLAYDVIARHMLSEDRRFFPLFQATGNSGKTAGRPADQAAEAITGMDELIDPDELQKLLSAFCESVDIAAAIVDPQGKVLVAANRQRTGTDFSRVNPESRARCAEGSSELALKLEDGSDYTIYRCKNGMNDAASPIIVEGQHLATVCVDQFHLGPPDLEFFRQQARQLGYPEAEYLQAIADAPIVDERRLPAILGFLGGLARMISTTSLARRRADRAQQELQQQADLLRNDRLLAMSLAEDNARARQSPAHKTEQQQ